MNWSAYDTAYGSAVQNHPILSLCKTIQGICQKYFICITTTIILGDDTLAKIYDTSSFCTIQNKNSFGILPCPSHTQPIHFGTIGTVTPSFCGYIQKTQKHCFYRISNGYFLAKTLIIKKHNTHLIFVLLIGYIKPIGKF